MQNKRPIISSATLTGRMKNYDSYRPVAGSVRGRNSFTKPQASSYSRELGQFRLSVAHNVNVSGARSRIASQKKTSTPTTSNQEYTAHASTTRRVALYSVAHAEATRNDILADQFVGIGSLTLSRKTMTRAQKLFYGVGMLIFIFASAASMQTFFVNHEAKEQLQVLGEQTQKPDEYGVVEGTGSDPAEAEVPKEALSAYKVNPELPRYLRVPDLGIFARIKHTGIDKNGAIDSPANINDVSWFRDSARPGNANGSSLLLGHVSGWTAPGIFKKLPQVKPGMRFEVEKGSGEKLAYEVTRTENIPLEQVDMAKILASVTPGEHDLKLMTCSGRYNKEKDIYEERFVVYAKILR